MAPRDALQVGGNQLGIGDGGEEGGRGVIWRHDWSEKKGGIFQSIKMRLNGRIDRSLFGGKTRDGGKGGK